MTIQIDISHGEQILGDKCAAKKILAMFIEQLPGYIQEIKQYRESGNWHQLYESVHAFKGATCYSSTPQLNVIAGELHSLLDSHDGATPHEKDIDRIDILLEDLRSNGQKTITESVAILD